MGLERGIKGSRARHTTIKQYYAAVTKTPDLTLDKTTIDHQLADRAKAIKEKEQAKRTAKSLAKKVEVLEGELSMAKAKIKLQNFELTNWKAKYTDLTNSVRDLPLKDVAYELGLEPDS